MNSARSRGNSSGSEPVIQARLAPQSEPFALGTILFVLERDVNNGVKQVGKERQSMTFEERS